MEKKVYVKIKLWYRFMSMRSKSLGGLLRKIVSDSNNIPIIGYSYLVLINYDNITLNSYCYMEILWKNNAKAV